MSLRWLLAGPLAGLGAVSGVIAALPDTHHRWWWIMACGVGAGLAALIGLLPSGDHAPGDLALTGIEADTLSAKHGGVVVGQQHAAQGGIAAGLLHQSGLSATFQPSRDMQIGNLTITQNLPSALPPEQGRTWTIPPPVSSFTGRQIELDRLHQELTANKSAVLVPTTALYGPGGIGKTQLALAYASFRRAEYELGWWIPAETPLSILAALAELAAALGLPQGLAPELLTRRIHEELSNRRNWLLVFDNAPDYASVENFSTAGRRWAHTNYVAESVLARSRRPNTNRRYAARRSRRPFDGSNWRKQSGVGYSTCRGTWIFATSSRAGRRIFKLFPQLPPTPFGTLHGNISTASRTPTRTRQTTGIWGNS